MQLHRAIMKALWPFTALLFCFGCGSKQSKKIKVYRESVASCEARLIDIPFPFDVSPVELELFSKNSDIRAQNVIEFITTLSREQLGEFYRTETERLGWKELSIFETANESLYIFEKPFKYCIITIRAYKKRFKVHCFISAK